MIYYVLETFGLTERQIPICRTDKRDMRELNSPISLFVCLFTKVHPALVVGGVVAV